jgi:dTDP-4-dehydrorhamnose reductase
MDQRSEEGDGRMRVLILGGDGMLGHQLLRHFKRRHDVRVTLRLGNESYEGHRLLNQGMPFYGIDARQMDSLWRVITDFHPDAVVNAIGIVKQRSDAKEVIPSIEINSLLPHRLAQACRSIGARLVHMSTDCVFSGRKGKYSEADVADADDLYGRSKLLGEVSEPHCITLRTSMIGPEITRKTGLLEWFISQQGHTVKGFTKAIFSGFPTSELARIVELILVDNPKIYGLYHVASAPINKYDLLTLIRDRLELPITIEKDSTFECDRSLDASLFYRDTGYSPPTWQAMIDDMANHMTERAQ